MASKSKKSVVKAPVSKAKGKPKAAPMKAVKSKSAPANVSSKSAKVEKPSAKAAPKVAVTLPAKKVTKEPKIGLNLEAIKAGRSMTKVAPAVALSKILPKEELAASYELADNEVDEFAEDEKARTTLEEVEEDVEGPPEWWKNDPAAIEGAEDEADGDKAEFDDSDEWTEDDEWADDEKKSDSDSDADDDRDW